MEVRALRFALEALAPGSALEGAEIVIQEPPGQAWCLRCGTTVAIQTRADPCPHCGGMIVWTPRDAGDPRRFPCACRIV